MMRTEVKIGISVAVLLIIVVVGYAIISSGSKPADNAGDNRVAKANSAPPITYDSSVNRAPAPTNGGINVWTPPGGGTVTPTPQRSTGTPEKTTDIFSSILSPDSKTTPTPAPPTPTREGTFDRSQDTVKNAASDSISFDYSRLPDPADTSFNPPGGLPGGTGGMTAPASEARTYTIKSGDTFSSIAREMYGDGKYASLLEKANPNIAATRMPIGTVVTVPPLPKTAATGTPVPGETGSVTVAVSGAKVYVVAEGDRLWTIARKTFASGQPTNQQIQARVDAIKKANPGLTDDIKVGDKIVLPDDATVVADTAAASPRTRSNETQGTRAPRTDNNTFTSQEGAPRPNLRR